MEVLALDNVMPIGDDKLGRLVTMRYYLHIPNSIGSYCNQHAELVVRRHFEMLTQSGKPTTLRKKACKEWW